MAENLEKLKVKLFLDSACKADLLEFANKAYIKGVTTNSTLMRKEGVRSYQDFAQELLALFPDRPLSLFTCADDFNEMEKQALKLASLGNEVYVKIPISNTRGESAEALIRKLSTQKIKLNITAVLTTEQVRRAAMALSPGVSSYISIFAGRIADTGRDPMLAVQEAMQIIHDFPFIELIWASLRELFNIVQANSAGCPIITVTPEILKKLPLLAYNLEDYSLDTVKMFYKDTLAAGYKL